MLRNRSIDNNRRQIRIQKKRLEQSDADFRLRTIDVISRVQQAYWELVFALRDQQNQLENLNLSRENLRNVEAQISAGAKAPLERAEVQTELANRESALLLAVQNVSIAENNLKQLMFKDSMTPEWSAQLTPTDTPAFSTDASESERSFERGAREQAGAAPAAFGQRHQSVSTFSTSRTRRNHRSIFRLRWRLPGWRGLRLQQALLPVRLFP